MLRSSAAVLAALAVAHGPAEAQGTSVRAGEKKAAACAPCHGRDGIASLPDAPNLAGQNATYFERALKEYRSGVRRNEVMSVAAKALTDEDIRDLAAYYGAFRITVAPPGK
jgi:cytochrome c553